MRIYESKDVVIVVSGVEKRVLIRTAKSFALLRLDDVKEVMERAKDHLNPEGLSVLASSILENVVLYIKAVVPGYIFSIYLLAYLFTVYQCLTLYESAGRYPEVVDVGKSRDKICQDIEKLKLIEEEVELIVGKVRDIVKTF